MANSPVNNLEFIVPLKHMTTLNISRTPIVDIKPLTLLPKLSSVDVSNTHLSEWEPLAKCKNLKTLFARECSGFNTKAIGDICTLKVLDMRNSYQGNLEFLSKMTKLECVWFENVERSSYHSSCKSGDLAVLKALPKLQQIGCSPEEFENIKFWFAGKMYFNVRGKEYVVEDYIKYTLVEYNKMKKL